jgi:glutamine synthetase
VGSSQSIAGANLVLNTIVAESLDDIATTLEAAVAAGKSLNSEIQALLPTLIAESKKVIFNGDNYSESWHNEAEKRGLPNRRNSVDSLPDLIAPKAIQLFAKYGIFTEREVYSRYEILLENYIKTINIEAQITVQMANRQILPAALRYQAEVAQAIAHLKAAGAKVPSSELALLEDLSTSIDELRTRTLALAKAASEHAPGDTLAHARHSRDAILAAMNAVRAAGDKLEGIVADDLWPLPTYQEMLFIK